MAGQTALNSEDEAQFTAVRFSEYEPSRTITLELIERVKGLCVSFTNDSQRCW